MSEATGNTEAKVDAAIDEAEVQNAEQTSQLDPTETSKDLRIEDILDDIDLGEVDSDQPSKSLEDVNRGTMSADEVAYDMLKKREEADPPNPIVNDPENLLNIAVQAGAPLQQAMKDPTKNDSLMVSVGNEDAPSTVLNNVMKEIAEEGAYMKAYRREHFLSDEDTSDISFKRVRSLKALVDTLVEKEKLKQDAGGKIDFYGDRFARVVKYFLEQVQETLLKVGIPSEFHDVFFVQLAKSLEGFEKKVEKIYYNKQ